MKKFATIVAFAVTLITAPAFAQTHADSVRHAPAVHGQSSDAIEWRGAVRGQDPDWFIRFQILRDAEAAHT